MSDESTTELIEYTRIVASHVDMPLVPFDAVMLDHAADRLTELDVKVMRLQDQVAASVSDRTMRDALRPPCPTCGGTQKRIRPGTYTTMPRPTRCPDCVDGKVSIEQLVATYNAVHDPALDNRNPALTRGCIDYLRSVKP